MYDQVTLSRSGHTTDVHAAIPLAPHFDAVIPQAALLAMGNVEDRPVVREGQAQVAQVKSVTLSCDHQVRYGAQEAESLPGCARSGNSPSTWPFRPVTGDAHSPSGVAGPGSR